MIRNKKGGIIEKDRRKQKKKPVIDVEAAVNRFFDDSSKKSRKKPTFTILMGGVCVGKSTLRREKYSHGHVLIDAAEIFLPLCKGEYLDFPSIHEKKMDQIGRAITLRAFKEKRNIVTEIIGADSEVMILMVDVIESLGYKVMLVPLMGDIAETWERNVRRGANNISAYYCEPYHLMWILDAIRTIKAI